MAEKQKQLMRYNDTELSLIKNTFAENDDLLKAIRKAILQLPLTAVDLSFLNLIKGQTELHKVIRKTFNPELDGETPFGQQIDLWLTIGLKEMNPDTAILHIKAIDLWIKYLDQQLSVLETGDYNKEQKLKLKDFADIKDKLQEAIFVEMLARNTIVNSSEQQLMQLMVLAGRKEDDVEKTKEKLKWNSSK